MTSSVWPTSTRVAPRQVLLGLEQSFSMLNMSSAAATQPAHLTTRARIRDAAVLSFAVHGFGVGLRSIATEAGVSAALIVHHFGSKDGLRAVCDEHVLAVIREAKTEAVTDATVSSLFAQLVAMDDYAPLLGYALRSLQAGGDLARDFVDHFAADAEVYCAAGVAAGTLVPSRDEKARARYLTVMGFGALLLDLTLNPLQDPTDLKAMLRGHLERTALPSIELFTHGLMTDNTVLDAYLLYIGDPPAAGTSDGPDHPSPSTPPTRESHP